MSYSQLSLCETVRSLSTPPHDQSLESTDRDFPTHPWMRCGKKDTRQHRGSGERWLPTGDGAASREGELAWPEGGQGQGGGGEMRPLIGWEADFLPGRECLIP